MVQWVVGSFLHGGPIGLFLVPTSVPRLVFQRLRYVLSCLWDDAYKKELLLLIQKSSPCSVDSGFPLLVSEWSFTICPTPYNRKQKVLSASLNQTFASFL